MKDKELTQSAKQTLKFFEDFVRRKEVADFVRWYRKHLNLPENGLLFSKEDSKDADESFLPHLYIPKRVAKQFPKEEKERPFRVINTCMAFTGQQGLKSYNIAFMLLYFLFFNEVTDTPLRMFDAQDDLLKLEHLQETLSEYGKEDPFLLQCAYEHFEHVSKRYPIALYINPDVSQRQIQDFLAKNWAFIESYRQKSKNSIAGVRKKSSNKRERNDYIYENRALPRKEIMRLVTDKFDEVLDYGHIGKIISLEKKRRENK